MSEQPQNEELAAGPNVNELVWALNAAEAEQAQPEGTPDLGDSDDAEPQQQPAPAGTTASTSSSKNKKKKKSNKAKNALNKLKDKLDTSGTNASTKKDAGGELDEAEVKGLQKELQDRIRAEHGQGMADKLTPDIAAQILRQANLQDLRRQASPAAPSDQPKTYVLKQ